VVNFGIVDRRSPSLGPIRSKHSVKIPQRCFLSDGEAFAAHPRIDPSCDQDGWRSKPVNFSISLVYLVQYYLWAKPDGKWCGSTFHSVRVSLSSTILQSRQTTAYFSKSMLSILYLLCSACVGWSNVKFQPNPADSNYRIPRDKSKSVQILETHSGFVFHHTNAFW